MKKRKLDPTYSAIMAEFHKTAQPIEPGFLTIQQWAEKWNKSISTTLLYLKKGTASGILERKVFRIKKSDNRVLPVPLYRPKKK